MLNEFKAFIARGNVMDLAVGVIIGAAFSKIVESVVNDLVMPLVGALTGGGFDFSNYFLALSSNVTASSLSDDSGKVKYFEGTPIPTSLLLVFIMAFAASQGAVGPNLWFGEVRLAGYVLHPLVLIYALSGSLMISRFHIPKI